MVKIFPTFPQRLFDTVCCLAQMYKVELRKVNPNTTNCVSFSMNRGNLRKSYIKKLSARATTRNTQYSTRIVGRGYLVLEGLHQVCSDLHHLSIALG